MNKPRTKWQVSKRVELEVEALDMAEAKETGRQFVEAQLSQDYGLGVMFRSQEDVTLGEVEP